MVGNRAKARKTGEVAVAPSVTFSQTLPFVLVAGPCQIESRQHSLDMAGAIADVAVGLGIPFVYKSSFDKANRTSVDGRRGVGLSRGLEILLEVKRVLGVPVLTDVHEPGQCAVVAEVVDILQIPAFLCRQTDLLLAAAQTGRVVNVKKGQFLAPWDTIAIAEKIESVGNRSILFTERGSCFGYNNLVVDMRALTIMTEQTGYPVIFDATHSTQKPGALGGSSGGDRRFAPALARAAAAVGVSGLFMEVHQDPENAPSDGPSMINLSDLRNTLARIKDIDLIVKTGPATRP